MTDRLRILMLNYEYPPLGGGAGNANRYLLREFQKDPDLSIDLITSSVGPGREERFSEAIGIRFLDIGKRGGLHYQTNRDLATYALRAYLHARERVARDRYDLVHAFFGIPCGYVALRLGLPYIVSLRGSDVPFYNPRFRTLDRLLFQRLSRRIWRRAERVVANSAGLRRLAEATDSTRPIEVIPNGVDTVRFCPVEGKPVGRPMALLSTGRLIQRKGYEALIEALAGQDGFALTLVGDGDRAGALRALADRLGVRVEFTGKLDQDGVIDRLRRADLFVLPSLNEGMSNAILEAMACGLPVIATDTGGSEELVSDNGCIVEKGSPEALRRALLRYRDDPARIAAEGRRSREKALAMSWESAARQYRVLYAEAKGRRLAG